MSKDTRLFGKPGIVDALVFAVIAVALIVGVVTRLLPNRAVKDIGQYGVPCQLDLDVLVQREYSWVARDWTPGQEFQDWDGKWIGTFTGRQPSPVAELSETVLFSFHVPGARHDGKALSYRNRKLRPGDMFGLAARTVSLEGRLYAIKVSDE